MKANPEPWYAAKTVYYYVDEDVYEERVVLHYASGLEDAWSKNEKETSEYIEGQKSIGVLIERVKTIEIYHLFDEQLKSGAEVFSSMRRVKGGRDEYIQLAYEEGMDYER